MNKERAKPPKESFEDYVKQHCEEEAVPYDDALRRLVATPPKPRKRSSQDGAPGEAEIEAAIAVPAFLA